jgi:hypothetical protein
MTCLRRAPFLGRGKVALSVIAVLFLAGCGGGPPAGKVAGTVRYKGQTLTGGMVDFFGPDNKVDTALIAPDGSYKAINVPLGSVKVAVRTALPEPSAAQAAKNPMMKRKNFVPKGNSEVVTIPLKYSDPRRSKLELTVIEGSQPFDINLD